MTKNEVSFNMDIFKGEKPRGGVVPLSKEDVVIDKQYRYDLEKSVETGWIRVSRLRKIIQAMKKDCSVLMNVRLVVCE